MNDELRCEVLAWRGEPKASTGWHIVDVRDADGRDLVVTGCHLPRPGSSAVFRGEWQSSRYGEQFFVRRVEAVRPPLSVDGVLRWFVDRCRGVGVKKAQALLDHFGDPRALWEAVGKGPDALVGIKGVDAELARTICETHSSEGADAEHYALLRGWKLTQKQIVRCLEHWETPAKVVETLQRDPYLLAEHINGFGFKRADEVARAVGIGANAPERIRAAVMHALDEAAGAGHMYADKRATAVVARELGVGFGDVVRAIVELRGAGRVVVVDGSLVYPRQLFDDESTILRQTLVQVGEAKDTQNYAF